jgi:hypothetical protein
MASAPTQKFPRPVVRKNHKHCLSTLATLSRYSSRLIRASRSFFSAEVSPGM